MPKTSINTDREGRRGIFPLFEAIQEKCHQYLRCVFWRYQLPNIQQGKVCNNNYQLF